MKYKIIDDKIHRPGFSIEEGDSYWPIVELNSCSTEYIVDEVLPNIKMVLSGEIKVFEFGYDATIVDFNKQISTINYNYFENKIEIESELLFHFLQEWTNQLISWRSKM